MDAFISDLRGSSWSNLAVAREGRRLMAARGGRRLTGAPSARRLRAARLAAPAAWRRLPVSKPAKGLSKRGTSAMVHGQREMRSKGGRWATCHGHL